MSVVTVRLFASYAELFGGPTLDIPLENGDTVGDLLEKVRTLPAASQLPRDPLVAVNRTFATADSPVTPGDEVALIPPVAGG